MRRYDASETGYICSGKNPGDTEIDEVVFIVRSFNKKITPKYPDQHGFTLIELLVVIAIVAILAAILFPVFARARENGRRASCQSNEKQLALAVLQYTQDNDERLFGHYTGPASSQVTWMNRLQPYIKSTQIFKCPSETEASITGGLTTANVSYCYNNIRLNDPAGSGETAAGQSLAAIAVVAETVLFAESTNRSGSRYVCNPTGSNPPLAPHLQGGVFAFVDGHVKWYPETHTIFKAAALWDLT